MYSSNSPSYTSQVPTYKPSPMMGFGSTAYSSSGSSASSSAKGVCNNSCRSVGVCTCK